MEGLEILVQNIPLPQLELLMEDLGTSVLSLPRITPPPPQKELELLMEHLRTSGLSLPKYSPPPKFGTSHGGHRDCGSELTKNILLPLYPRGYRLSLLLVHR